MSGISSPSYNFPTNNAWCLPFPIIKTKKKRFFFEKSVDAHTKPSNQMQCLSESCGGPNLFLESVRVAIVNSDLSYVDLISSRIVNCHWKTPCGELSIRSIVHSPVSSIVWFESLEFPRKTKKWKWHPCYQVKSNNTINHFLVRSFRFKETRALFYYKGVLRYNSKIAFFSIYQISG